MGQRISITAGPTAGNGRRAATHYGTREIEDVIGSVYPTDSGHEVLEYVFSFDDLPVAGLDAAILQIPANAVVKSASIDVITAMTGSSGTLTLGLRQPDNTVIDADGIDAAVAQAALVINARIACDGALIGATIGVNAGQLVVTSGGTVTAGKFLVRIEYEPTRQRA